MKFILLVIVNLIQVLFTAAQIENDLCDDRIGLSVGDNVLGSTINATDEGFDADDCGNIVSPGVWFAVTGNGAPLSASLCDGDTTYDTQLSVFTGDCGSPVCVDWNDNDDTCGSATSQSSVSWVSLPEVEYFILVHGSGIEAGDFRLIIEETGEPNDQCSNAESVAVGDFVQASTVLAFFDLVADCGSATLTASPGLWYIIAGTGELLSLTTCFANTNFDAQISVFDGNCDDLNCVVGNDMDTNCDFQGASVLWTAEAAVDYYVLIHGFFGEGDFDLALEAGASNDQCINAQTIAIAEFVQGSTVLALEDNVDDCGTASNTASPGVWYVIQGTGQIFAATTCFSDTNFNAQISVFDGDCDGLNCIGGNDADPNCAVSGSTVNWEAVLGVNYYILVHGSSDQGDFGLIVEETGEVNDLCTNAQSITVGEFVQGSTTLAFVDLLGDCGTATFTEAPGVWYLIVGTGDVLIATTCFTATTYDTQISVFDGSCGDLVCVAGNDNDSFCADSTSSSVAWTSQLGVDYYILVHGFFDQGDFGLEVTTNDLCVNAEFVDIGGSAVGSTINSGLLDNLSTCGGVSADGAPGLWYTTIGNGRLLRAHTCDATTDFNTQLLLFSNTCDNLVCIDGNNNFCGVQSEVQWASVDGEIYYIFVYGNNEVGNFLLSIEDISPLNDLCQTAEFLDIDADTDGTTIYATYLENYDDHYECGSVTRDDAPGVWYYTIGNGRRVRVHTCGRNDFGDETDFDTQIIVFNDDCDDLECIGGNNNDCGDQSAVEFQTEEDTNYLIYVFGNRDAVGFFHIKIDEIGPENDYCDDALQLDINDSRIGSTRWAHRNLPSNVCGNVTNNDAPGVFYVSSGNGNFLRVHTCGTHTCGSQMCQDASTNFDSQILVFSGGCSENTCVGGNNDGYFVGDICGQRSSVVWESIANIDYYIYVYGNNEVGDFRVSLDDISPSNNRCNNAIGMPLGGTMMGSTVYATPDDQDVCVNATYSDVRGVWYVVMGTGRTMMASTCKNETTFEAHISVFTGPCGDLTCVDVNDMLCTSNGTIVTWESSASTQYYILVHNSTDGEYVGDFSLEIGESTIVVAATVSDCPCRCETGVLIGLPGISENNYCVTPRTADFLVNRHTIAACVENCPI